MKGAIVVLEPRRVAARAVVRRMAELSGERVGDTVGYQVRWERVGGPKTRIWVVTDGILLRRLQDDPLLDGVGAVLLDEVHERGLETDRHPVERVAGSGVPARSRRILGCGSPCARVRSTQSGRWPAFGVGLRPAPWSAP